MSERGRSIRDLFRVRFLWPGRGFTTRERAMLNEARARLESGNVEGSVALIIEVLERP